MKEKLEKQAEPEPTAEARQSVAAIVMPPIVCLCGSTRFYNAFQEANFRETMAGKIVLSVGFYPHSTEQSHGEKLKEKLDELHKRKIDLADEILVLNVGKYIGASTGKQILYARKQGKLIRYLEADFECYWCKLAGLPKEEFTLPLDQLGGTDAETGMPICQDCLDTADQDQAE